MRTNAASRRVLRSYYAIVGLYTLSAALIWGVNTLFLLDAGLGITEVFVANAAFSLGMVLFEIPTGVVADTVGRRVSFLASTVVLALSTVAYVALASVGAGVWAFAGVSVFMGLGFTFYSGATEAWVVDALAANDYGDELDHAFARGQMVTGAGMLVGTIGGGLLGTVDLAYPFVARAVLLGLAFAVAFATMRDEGFEVRALTLGSARGEMARVARDSVAFGWREPGLRRLMLVGAVQTGFFFWGFYAFQPYFLELLDSDAVWIMGVVSALVAVSTMAGNAVVEWFTRFCGKRTTLMLWGAAAMTVGAIGVGLAGVFWVALPALLLITASTGVTMPVRQSYFHNVIPTEQRATVVSLDSMVGGLGGAAGQAGLGRIAQVDSYSTGYLVGGAATVLALPLLWSVRRLGEPADHVIGASAGIEGACAAQGLPGISGVETAPPPVVEAVAS